MRKPPQLPATVLSFIQFVLIIQQFGHGQIINIFCLFLKEFSKADSLTLIGGQKLQGHQIAEFIIQSHNDRIVPALSGQDLGLDKTGAADLSIETGNSIICPLLDRKRNGIFRQRTIRAALFGDFIVLIFQFLQMPGTHHLRNRSTYIKIAQTIILITQYIDLLNIYRVTDPCHNKQNQNLHIKHIMDKTQSLHIHHLLLILYRMLQKNQAPVHDVTHILEQRGENMKDILVYPAFSSDVGKYVTEYLKAHKIPVIDHLSPEITHLLLDVPTREVPENLLERLPEDVCVMGGNLDVLPANSHKHIDLLKNEWYLARNAAITAECALQVASAEMNTVFFDSSVLIVGWGRIGKCLACLLKAIGANVTVAARNDRDRALAEALGYASITPGQTPEGCQIVFNTVPFPVMEADSRCLNIDLASGRGILGDSVIWARGLPGKYAPESSGQLIGKAFLREVRK